MTKAFRLKSESSQANTNETTEREAIITTAFSPTRFMLLVLLIGVLGPFIIVRVLHLLLVRMLGPFIIIRVLHLLLIWGLWPLLIIRVLHFLLIWVLESFLIIRYLRPFIFIRVLHFLLIVRVLLSLLFIRVLLSLLIVWLITFVLLAPLFILWMCFFRTISLWMMTAFIWPMPAIILLIIVSSFWNTVLVPIWLIVIFVLRVSWSFRAIVGSFRVVITPCMTGCPFILTIVSK